MAKSTLRSSDETDQILVEIPDRPTVLWMLHQNGSILTCTVRVTRQGFELATAIDGRMPHAGLIVQTEDELYGWAERFRQADLSDGWEERSDTPSTGSDAET